MANKSVLTENSNIEQFGIVVAKPVKVITKKTTQISLFWIFSEAVV
jgi:hypothetical protein